MGFFKMFRNWKDVEEYPVRTIIFAEGNPAEYLYVILSGEVELSLRGEALEVEKTGGIIGEMALFELATRNSTATALTDVKLARVDRDQLNGMMQASAEFSQQIMAVLANRLRTVNNYISMRLGPA
jgi:CRP-like cAMP-binding protein